MNQATPHKSPYRSEIDGLRAFAVLSVVVFHAFPGWLAGGFIGVDVFFVISGFLITTHIFENLDRGQFSFTDFFSRRIRRIFPALILVLACSLAFGWFALLADEFAQLGKHVASAAAFISNFILVDESGYFGDTAETKPMLHLWSLAIEEQFYIVWPLVLWLAWKRNFNLLTITILIGIASFYLNLSFVNSHPKETFYWPAGRFWELLSGSVLAWLLLYKSDLLSQFKQWLDKFLVRIIHSKEVDADGSTASNLMSFFGLLLLTYAVIHINESLSFPSKWALFPVSGAVLVIASGSRAWFNRIFLMNPIAVWFGLISYPLYLWHWPILSFLQIVEGQMPATDARVLAVLLAVVLAWLTYTLVESPIRFGYLKRKLSPIFIAVMLFSIGGIGYYVSVADWAETNGFEDVIFPRKGFEHGFGSSLKWYKGTDNWLFLGNYEQQTVAKRRLAFEPSSQNISNEVSKFETLAEQGRKSNTKIALLVGPNKSSVYAEYLPYKIMPSERRYSTFITDELKDIPNLVVVDPTNLLVDAKLKEGILYNRTDTHWNQKGSYLAFKSLMEELSLKAPNVDFRINTRIRRGDLIELSKLSDFPLSIGDEWIFTVLNDSDLEITPNTEQKDPFNIFGTRWESVVKNAKGLNDLSVWVVGDSFTDAVKPYLNASFREIRYLRQARKLNDLPLLLRESSKKPDLVLVVRVERSF